MKRKYLLLILPLFACSIVCASMGVNGLPAIAYTFISFDSDNLTHGLVPTYPDSVVIAYRRDEQRQSTEEWLTYRTNDGLEQVLSFMARYINLLPSSQSIGDPPRYSANIIYKSLLSDIAYPYASKFDSYTDYPPNHQWPHAQITIRRDGPGTIILVYFYSLAWR
jgi:hypothetical protein